MKQSALFLLVFCLFVISSCQSSSQVITKDDPFTKSKIVTLELWHKVIDGTLDNTTVIYKKEIKNGEISPATATFFFRAVQTDLAGTTIQNLTPTAYMLIKDKSYKFIITDMTSEKTTLIDVEDLGDRYDVDTTKYKDMKGKIVFTHEMEKEILKGDSLMYRFYQGENASTLNAEPDQLAKVKEFFAAGIGK
jgi:hypothetical protein